MQLKHVPIANLHLPELDEMGISLSVKRDDLQDPIVSGNKLYKLFYHLEQIKKSGIQTLVTYGGAYSNHLHATAYAARQLGVQSVGIVRGEQLLPLNPTLKDCVNWGMVLEPVPRIDYKNRKDSPLINRILKKYPSGYIIPEGGCDLLGVKGAQKILDHVDQSQFDYIVCPCGTGTTVSGIISTADSHIQVLGMAVLKGADWMKDEVAYWLKALFDSGEEINHNNWSVNTEFHFGGYGKITQELKDFIHQMNEQVNLPLDPVYTSKSLFGILDLAQQGYFKKGSRILLIHTGGLQGARS